MRVRRPAHELRVEIMPLIDVVFLLLTFFILASVVMAPVSALPLETQPITGAQPTTVPPAATITLDAAGGIFLDREAVDLDGLIAALQERLATDAATVVYLAAAREGEADRLPAFLELYGALAEARVPVSLVSLDGSGDGSAGDAAPDADGGGGVTPDVGPRPSAPDG